VEKISDNPAVALLLWLLSATTEAALSPSATLIFDVPVIDDGLVVAGSNFGVDFTNDGVIDLSERTGLAANDGLILGVAQPGSVSSPGIDRPWDFFGQQGVHYTTSAVGILSDDGVGNVELDFRGWSVNWNGMDIGLGGAAWGSNPDGTAIMSCDIDCSVGDNFTLFYTATVTGGAFTGVRYRLGFDSGATSAPAGIFAAAALPEEDPGIVTTGTIKASVVPVPAAIWLFGCGVLGLLGMARHKKLPD
jgi:hypothetical protein